MSRSRLAGATCLAAATLVWPQPVGSLGNQAERLSEHASHSPVTSDERALRELLARFSRGDIEGAVRGLLATPGDWSRRALDACMRRIDDHIKYHRRPENRLSVVRDERLERFVRADRLQVLLLTAAIQLEASRAVADVDAAGAHVVESERAIDRLYALRSDFDENGPVPWPIDNDEPRDDADLARGQPASVDWPAVRAFVSRWYSAAIARLQQMVEIRLAPALVARGLARFPGHADLLLARGSFIETRLALAQVDASLDMLYAPEITRRWRNELSEAETDLARAVQAAGPASEAAVRLARVRLLKGQVARSRELLDRVLAGDVPVEIRYLALLFRAAAAEASGNVQDATRDYRAAVESIPGAQTPMLALGRIADEHNQVEDARQWVERALDSDTAALDPWRRYIQGQAWQASARIASLRTLESR